MAYRDYAMPSPDPLSANWSYDNAIDLFSLNTIMPESFPVNDMVWDPKDFPADFFAPPPDINGFTISNHSGEDSLSSDLESDDQSYSPTNPISTESLFQSPINLTASPIDTLSPPALSQPAPTPKPQPQKRTSRRWSEDSSPEIHPQDTTPSINPSTAKPLPSGTPKKIPRSLSDDSARGRNAAKRAAHNIIEKRYRTNMNAKFVALEKAMAGSKSPSPSSSSKSSTSSSLKKSEILSNAIAYMQELQETNEKLRKELSVMGQNLQVSGGLCRAFPR